MYQRNVVVGFQAAIVGELHILHYPVLSGSHRLTASLI